jgi:predicted DNA binding CopG/RHH family protein
MSNSEHKYYDEEERDLIEEIEHGPEWPVVSPEKEEEIVQAFRDAIDAKYKKKARVNFRITEEDFTLLKARALEEGIPYQTLLSKLVHRFVKNPVM